MSIIDLSHPIREGMPVYPGTRPPTVTVVSDYEPDLFRERLLSLCSHTGTHVDVPAHVFPGGKTLSDFSTEALVGRALVIDCRHLGADAPVTMTALSRYGDKVRAADYLLFCFGFDRHWGSPRYFEDYPCLDLEVIDFIAKGGYKGIGLDTVSLDPVGSLERHRRLFSQADILTVENLTHLELLGDDLFDFYCLPLPIEGGDGAPVRAVAILP